MIWVDYLILGIILISSGISIIRGFVKEVLSLLSWLLALFVAATFYLHLATLMVDIINDSDLRSIVSFLILFVVTLILGALINHLIGQLVEKTGLSGTDRSLGIIFGIFRGIAIVTILALVASVFQLHTSQWWQNSLLLEHFEKSAIWVKQFLPSDFADYINF